MVRFARQLSIDHRRWTMACCSDAFGPQSTDHSPRQKKVHGPWTIDHSKKVKHNLISRHPDRSEGKRLAAKSTVNSVRHSLFGEGVPTTVHGKKVYLISLCRHPDRVRRSDQRRSKLTKEAQEYQSVSGAEGKGGAQTSTLTDHGPRQKKTIDHGR